MTALAYASPFHLSLIDSASPALHAGEAHRLRAIIENSQLSAVFQPIVDFRNHTYFAFEGLIRGPENSPLHTPKALFETADLIGARPLLERACRETVFRAFARLRLPGKLFINASPDSLDDPEFLDGTTEELLRQLGIKPNRVVIEITENQHINDFPGVHQAVSRLRDLGCQIAIDDLGEGFANLRLWSEIHPDYVKIDRHFIDGIAEDTLKHHFVKAMQNLAESCAATIVAEGIESEADCLAVRDLGIACGQGFLIALPVASPRTIPSEKLVQMVKQKNIIVFPHASTPVGNITVRSLMRRVEPVSPGAYNDEVYLRFGGDPELMSMPVVMSDGTAVGMINRHELVDRMARPYHRELYGRKACSLFMDDSPLCIDEGATIQEAALMVSRSARRHIYDGFIITRNGRYAGIGSAHDLMGMITEMQIQAARYANPLTQLPGSVPINEHIDRLLERRVPFHACYFDIDCFKPFNDAFGYRRGDDVIALLAQTLHDIVNPLADFCGHIGGDDFMVLFQSADWERRCREALSLFDGRLQELVGPDLLTDGGYYAENRRGQMDFYSLPGLSIGAVFIGGSEFFESHREVAAAAAEAKKNAKRMPGSSLFIERRKPA